MNNLNEKAEEFDVNKAFEAFKKKVDGMNIEERKEYFKKMGLKIELENK